MSGEQIMNGTPQLCLVRGELHELATLALVLEAMDIAHHIDEQRGELLVAEDVAARATQEINFYRSENRDWPERRPTAHAHVPVAPTLLMLAALVLLFSISGPWALQGEWFARGMVNAQAIVVGGQWWRVITGLTLHADAVHLLGNCLLGGLLIHLFSGSVGYGLAWAMVLCSAALGNGLNVLLRQQHLAVGFSTAVFAVIGVLVSMEMVRVRRPVWRHVALPLGAGVALLTLLGSEGEHADLGAHLFGFVAGLGTGWPLGLPWMNKQRHSAVLQALLFTLTGGIVVLAWWLAWR